MGSGEIVSPNTPTNASDLISTLRDRAPRFAMGIAAGQMAWPVIKQFRVKAKDRTTYTIKVRGNDEIYDDLHEWVLGLLPQGHQRALEAWTTSRSDGMAILGDSSSPSSVRSTLAPAPRVRLRYDGSREQTIMVAGHKIDVNVNDPDASVDRRYRPPEIIFSASSAEGQRQLVKAINDLAARAHEHKRKPVFRMLSSWGEWERLDDLATRELDSVVLQAGQMERLIADVDKFLSSEEDYVRRSIPWHRGHFYEGPPGTGKTSVARAVASHFGMDVWYLPLADIQKDGDLLRVANRIGPRSMLLLEDVDVFHSAKDRDDKEGNLTLSGLLNTLDGIATPHGLLTVLTTNDAEVLDPAVVRPGRVDLVEHFGYADRDQAARLLGRWYGVELTLARSFEGAQICPAEIIESCKRHEDLASCLAELDSRTQHEPVL